jgi:putative ABC transport system substrate-binding protein
VFGHRPNNEPKEFAQFALGQLIALAMAVLMLTAIVIGTLPARAGQEAWNSPTVSEAIAKHGQNGPLTGKAIVADAKLILRRFELIKQAVPGIARVGVLWQPDPDGENTKAMLQDIGKAASATGLSVQFIAVSDPAQLETGLSEISKGQVNALVVMLSTITVLERRYIVDSIAKTRLPAMYAAREFVQDGGLMSYAAPRSAVGDAAHHLDGTTQEADPAHLTLEQPEKIELVVNLKTASRLGIALNREFLALVDRIIE